MNENTPNTPKPPKQVERVITVRMDAALHTALGEAAIKGRTSINKIALAALRNAIEQSNTRIAGG